MTATTAAKPAKLENEMHLMDKGFGQTMPANAQFLGMTDGASAPAAPNFADAVIVATKAVSGLVERVELLQVRLVGSHPEKPLSSSVGSTSDGVFPTTYWAAEHIRESVSRIHELLDRIESALPHS